MTTYDFVQLSLYACGGKIQGRTKLQKTVYFLGLMTGHLDKLGYQAHYYGPYSAEVAEAISTLEGIGFASSTIASVGTVDPQGFEIRRSDYTLTEEVLVPPNGRPRFCRILLKASRTASNC